MTPDDKPLFFVHLMKTAGTTLKFRLLASFESNALYPNPIDDDDQVFANLNIAYLRSMSDERRRRTLVYAGHFPYCVTEMVGVPVATAAVLRDPVERVVSHLKQLRQNEESWVSDALERDTWDDPSFEDLYANEYLRRRFFVNYQCRMFALTVADDPEDHLHQIDMNDERLAIAKRHLEHIDVLGLTEDYDPFIAQLHERFGITAEPFPKVRVGKQDWDVTPELRRQIEQDNVYDIALYEHAQRVLAERTAGSDQ